MPTPSQPKISLYFDGLCHLCSREINHYRGLKGAERIRFVDITAQDFNAQKEGVDPLNVHQLIHVKDAQGDLHVGVDAFIQVWEQLDRLKFLSPIARMAPVHGVLNVFYHLFAKVRPLLPRKSCEASPFCEMPSPRS